MQPKGQVAESKHRELLRTGEVLARVKEEIVSVPTSLPPTPSSGGAPSPYSGTPYSGPSYAGSYSYGTPPGGYTPQQP